MVELYHAQPSAGQKFIGDYFYTFARLLDPHLAPSVRAEDEETTRWPLGQTVAFATIVSLGLWGSLAAILYYCA